MPVQTPLPILNRPEEWRKWTGKAKNGVRPYNDIPPIPEPAEFGESVSKWWHTLQPSFRVADAGTLLPTYSDPLFEGDPWVTIRKLGPNGFVSLITLLDWWGRSAHSANVFQDDSRPAWKSLVLDVGFCLEAMLKSVGADAKRPLDEVPESMNKRYVLFVVMIHLALTPLRQRLDKA